jgi:hypothetical protein
MSDSKPALRRGEIGWSLAMFVCVVMALFSYAGLACKRPEVP